MSNEETKAIRMLIGLCMRELNKAKRSIGIASECFRLALERLDAKVHGVDK